MDLEKRLEIIQRSTRTTVPYFVPAHNALRMQFPWYYKWHLFRYASVLHLLFVVFFTISFCSLLYNLSIPKMSAIEMGFVKIDTTEGWNAGTKSNLLVADNQISIDDKSYASTGDIVPDHITYNPGESIDRTFDLGSLYQDIISANVMAAGPAGLMSFSTDNINWASITYLMQGDNTFAASDVRYVRIQDTCNYTPYCDIDEITLYSSSKTARHISTATQLDNENENASWTTFQPSASIPANTSVAFRFRSSTDSSTWSSWTASTAYAGSINIGTLLGNTDKQKRYLQVETTLANTDGSSTPTLTSYRANYSAICPAGTSELDDSATIDIENDWKAGSLSNIDADTTSGSIKLSQAIDINPASISASTNSGSAGNVIDGNNATTWGFQTCDTTHQWWKADLAQTYSISGLHIITQGDAPGQYYVYGSNNDVDYTQIHILSGIMEDTHQFGTPVNYRYIKVEAWNDYAGACDGGYPPPGVSVAIAEFELFPANSGIHLSAPSQLDGTADLSTWTTFAPAGTINANTSINFKFRTSSDASNWGSWTAATPYAASIDLTTLLSQSDVALRYLQVETTLASSDGVNTPILNSYTASYIACTPEEPVPTCSDGLQNGDETGVDCGGSCESCPVPETCDDGIQNQDETGVDCGGSCSACPVEPTCNDGIRNQGETGVDCGGPCGACPVPPAVETCTDGIQNQDETNVDSGGVCGEPKICKLNECVDEALNSFSDCQFQASIRGSGWEACSNNYCEASHACYDTCGGGDAKTQYTALTAPNGGESYNINAAVPIRWYYLAQDGKTKMLIDNAPAILSLSLDSGITYSAIKLLVPHSNYGSPLVQAARRQYSTLDVGLFNIDAINKNNSYSWVPGQIDYVSPSVRLKIEPLLYNCVINIEPDTSDNDFELFANYPQLIANLTPSLASISINGEATFTAKAILDDGTDVTADASFDFSVSSAFKIISERGNNITIKAGQTAGLFDKVIAVEASYQSLSAEDYSSVEVKEDTITDSPTPPDDKCTFLCEVIGTIKGFIEEAMAAQTARNALSALALLISGLNLAANSILLGRNLIAPFMKGKEKHSGRSLVYDVSIGQPISGIKIILINKDLGNTSAIATSDKYGHFNLELSPGKTYQIKIEGNGYELLSPSASRVDTAGLPYDNNYFGDTFTAGIDEVNFSRNLPALQTDSKLEAAKLMKRARFNAILIGINIPLLLIGSGISLVILYYYPIPFNYIVILLYVLALIVYLVRTMVISGRGYGRVIDKSEGGKPVDLAVIRAYRAKDYHLEHTVLSDQKGRYTLSLPKGVYHIRAIKSGLEQLGEVSATIRSSVRSTQTNIEMQKHTSDANKSISKSASPEVETREANSPSELIDRYHTSDQT